MLTIQLAAELKDAGIKVNSADPGSPPPTSMVCAATKRYRREQLWPSV